MGKKEFILNGLVMKSQDLFYDEVQKILCPGFKHFGRNLSAFNDILRGGFGKFELHEEIILKISNKKSLKKNLGENFLKKIIQVIESSINVELIWITDH